MVWIRRSSRGDLGNQANGGNCSQQKIKRKTVYFLTTTIETTELGQKRSVLIESKSFELKKEIATTEFFHLLQSVVDTI